MQVVLFDLDNTLYPPTLDVVPRIDRRINEYMTSRLGIPAVEVDALRREFWLDYGTTLRGLMLRHRIDPDDYLDYVHDVDLADVLQQDPGLRRVLEAIPGRKVVFTNASRSHASQVLRLLGIEGAFETVFGLEDLSYVPKPIPQAYEIVLTRLEARGSACMLVEDNRKNLVPAKRLGMKTVWISESAPEDDVVDHVIPSVHALGMLFGE